MNALIRTNPGNGLLPAVVALAVAAAIVSITIARQQVAADRLIASGRPVAIAETASAAPAAASPTLVRSPIASPASFSREGDVIRIRASGMPRALAAEQLARLTRARIVAGGQWLALAPDLSLEWQGDDAAEAWKRVLGNGVRNTVACGDDGCTVRILSIDVDGGSVAVPEPLQASKAGSPPRSPGLMNQPTDPDAIDESALGP